MSFNYNYYNLDYQYKNYCFNIFIINIIKADKYLKTKSSNKYKIVRCNQCCRCLQQYDCLKCKNCLNKPKLGGDGSRKQGCIYKKCINPTKLYNY